LPGKRRFRLLTRSVGPMFPLLLLTRCCVLREPGLPPSTEMSLNFFNPLSAPVQKAFHPLCFSLSRFAFQAFYRPRGFLQSWRNFMRHPYSHPKIFLFLLFFPSPSFVRSPLLSLQTLVRVALIGAVRVPYLGFPLYQRPVRVSLGRVRYSQAGRFSASGTSGSPSFLGFCSSFLTYLSGAPFSLSSVVDFRRHGLSPLTKSSWSLVFSLALFRLPD